MNEVLVLIGANPGWAGSQGRRIFSGLVFDVILLVAGAHDVERTVWLLAGLLSVGHLVEVVVHDFAQIDQRVLLNLNFSLLVYLNARSMHDTKITYVVTAILANDHQLAFPQFLVVRNLVVVCLTLTDLEHSLSAVNGDAESLKLLSVDSFEGHVELGACGLVGQSLKSASLKIAFDCQLDWGQFLELARGKLLILGKLLEAWVLRWVETWRETGDQFGAPK